MSQTTWPENEAPATEPDPAEPSAPQIIYSVRCPACFSLTGESDDECSQCGHVTSWTSSEEFASFYRNTKREGAASVLRGAITAIVGIVVLIAIASAVFVLGLELDSLIVALWLGTCAVALYRGIFMFRRGRRLMLFE